MSVSVFVFRSVSVSVSVSSPRAGAGALGWQSSPTRPRAYWAGRGGFGRSFVLFVSCFVGFLFFPVFVFLGRLRWLGAEGIDVFTQVVGSYTAPEWLECLVVARAGEAVIPFAWWVEDLLSAILV